MHLPKVVMAPVMKSVLLVALGVVTFVFSGCSKKTQDAGATLARSPDALSAAFETAFPKGRLEKDSDGNTLTFEPEKLVPVQADGRVQALISEGSLGQDIAHVQQGALRITYLNASGGGFSLPRPPIQLKLGGDGFGAPPGWAIIELHHKPAIRVVYAYGNMGCTDTTLDVYILGPSSITKDRRASKPMKEECEDAGQPVGHDLNAQTDTNETIKPAEGADKTPVGNDASTRASIAEHTRPNLTGESASQRLTDHTPKSSII